VQRGYFAVITFFLLACSVFSLSQVAADELTIKKIFSAAGPAGRAPESFAWSPDGKQLTYIQRDDSGERGVLYSVDPATGARTELINVDKLMQLSPPVSQIREERTRDNRLRYKVAAYHWAPDSRHILFDALGQLWYYSLSTGTAIHLTASPSPVLDPQFSPDGKHIAFVRDHNLVVHSIKDSLERQLTREKEPSILNGEVPWIYAEELDVRSAYAWSPDNKRILFLQADQTKIPTYPLTDWLEIHPPTEMMRYPKAGDPNPAVRLGVIDADGGKPKWLELTEEADVYIPRFGWVAQDLAYAMVLNRAQTQLDLYFINTRTGRSSKMLTEKSEPFLELTDGFQVLTGLAQFIWPSWRDGHTHLYLYRYDQKQPLNSSAELVRQITSGDWEVNSVEKVDEPKGLAYIVANKDDDRQFQLYSVPLSGGPLTRITKAPGDHSLKFSPGGEYFVDNYSSLVTPPIV
jgi:dipeptidyl-peptidase-4